MKLSIVATLYRSASTIDEFYRRAMAAGEALTDNVEPILVNDVSPDDSRERALALHAVDSRIVVVDLARNFGHHKAMMTGLMHARGTSLIVSVWFFGGLITLIRGILSIYIANLLSESKRRPYAMIRHIYRATEPADEAATNVIRTSLGSARAEIGQAR